MNFFMDDSFFFSTLLFFFFYKNTQSPDYDTLKNYFDEKKNRDLRAQQLNGNFSLLCSIVFLLLTDL